MTIYEQEGHATRQQYLNHLAEEYGVSRHDVAMMADLLGESEDFDGLVSMLDDFEGGF
jgi:hypothetical protein